MWWKQKLSPESCSTGSYRDTEPAGITTGWNSCTATVPLQSSFDVTDTGSQWHKYLPKHISYTLFIEASWIEITHLQTTLTTLSPSHLVWRNSASLSIASVLTVPGRLLLATVAPARTPSARRWHSRRELRDDSSSVPLHKNNLQRAGLQTCLQTAVWPFMLIVTWSHIDCGCKSDCLNVNQVDFHQKPNFF